MFSELLRLVVALFGAWTLYAQSLIFLRYDFATLRLWSLVPLVLACLLLFFLGRRAPAAEPVSATIRVSRFHQMPSWFWLLCPFVIVGLHLLTGSDWAYWVLASAFFYAASVAFRAGSVGSKPQECDIAAWEWLALAGICGIAILLTGGNLRADPDDAYFLSLASSALDHPTVPLYGFDNLYRSGLPLLEQAHHLMQSYEYFVAVLASAVGVSVHTLYYLVLPVFWVAVGMTIYWKLLRHFLPPGAALIGLGALVFFLALWGDEHRTYGNFGFVRMYQGKAIYLIVALPMIVWSAVVYSRNPTWRNWLLLMLHQCAAVGFSLTALFVAPLAAAAVLLAGMQWSRHSLRITVAGVAASSVVLFAAVGMNLYLADYIASISNVYQALPAPVTTAIHPEVNKFYQVSDTIVLGYQTVLGPDRVNLVLLALLLLPYLMHRAKLRGLSWICNYLFVCTLLLMCPGVSIVLGTLIVDVLSWRVFWSWPVPLLLALAIGAVACIQSLRPWLRVLCISATLLLFAMAGPSAVMRETWAWENMGRYKVFPSHGAAEYLMDRIDLARPALVPEEMAISLVGFSNAPPLVAVRNYYLRTLPGFVPIEDLYARRALLSYIDKRVGHIATDWVMDEIDARDVATVAFREDHQHAVIFSAALDAKGFEIEHRFGHVLAIKALQVSPVEQ